MTKTQLIEQCNITTERKFEKYGLKIPLLLVLQDFCGRNRYWWRKWSFSFNTVLGTPTYDLSAITTTPSLTDISVEEITVLSMINAGTVVELDPVFDDQTVNSMIEGYNINGTTGAVTPSRYTIDPNGYSGLRIDTPNGVYKLRASAWMMPNPATDSTSDAVPIVPPWHHKAIMAGMEAYVWKRIYGPEDSKFITANKEYEDAIILAQARPRFTTNYNQQFIGSGEAIRST